MIETVSGFNAANPAQQLANGSDRIYRINKAGVKKQILKHLL